MISLCGSQLYQKEEIPAWVTFDLWSKIAAAVNTIHIRHIVHQDLKPENILITDVSLQGPVRGGGGGGGVWGGAGR